ncbi:MAG: heme exporter protein CcmD [Xanthomonadales bacterium]|nr:heme exporter protein CcmD [Xanthomonadales bacterium]|tara:strand:+ start:1839 stop:2006 length:168 start_codon:yes stop_codon:yes gene_type:complete
MNDSWQQFLHMGGYARYVWSAYGIAAAVMLANVVAPIVALARIKRRIAREEFVDD